ncbi:MAG TPA: peptidoglycan DD-metalloendopeptidase family protein [Usitatibacter sp.]|nr:peptidoglycan DD-metalloendopeptidase family protein [Usitatibacter sp.]
MRSTAVVLALVFVATPAAAARKAAPSDEDLRELRGRIERLQKGLAAKEESRGEATEQLRASSKAVSEARRSLFELAERRREIEGELAQVESQEKDTRASIAQQEELAGKLLRLQYQQGSPDRLRLLLEGRDAATVARQLEYYGYIQRARGELIEGLRRKGEKLAQLGEEARQRREELAGNEAQQAEEAKRLEKERAARAALVGKLAGEIARGRREIGRLKRDEARLAKLVEEIARAIARPPRRNTAPAKRVENVADASSSSKPFESLRGRLRLPVRGELAGRFGQPREEAGTTWKGLFIRSVTGETVHAVADGRVVYADWLRGFGNLLILDHGAGFMSLYAYNEGLLRKVGEMVRGGDPIAEVGQSGQSAESGLYFELRRDGKPFDPMRWVAQ